jgi:hypothetical protein
MFGGVHRSSVQADMGRMGVAWFHHTATSQDVTPSRATSLRHPKRLRDRIEDMVDVIDIEDEDHSFAAFFIGMNNRNSGGRNVVKRPLVRSGKDLLLLRPLLLLSHTADLTLN